MYFEGINLSILLIISAGYVLLLCFFGLFRQYPLPSKEAFCEKPKARIDFFDFAKGIAILAVIIIHSCYFPLYLTLSHNNFSPSFFVISEQINRAMRFAIPVFLISSGALLFLNNLGKESLKNFCFKKAKRIVLPYVLFSALGTYIFASSGNFIFFNYLSRALKDIFTGSALLPYWFVPVLLQLYIIYPILWYLFVKKKISPAKILLCSFLISLICYFVFYYKYLGWQRYLGQFYFFGSVLFFFVLGMIFKSMVLTENRQWLQKSFFLLFSFLIILMYFLLGLLSPTEAYFNERLIYGPVVFLLLFYFYPLFKKVKISGFFERIGKQSLYIYLLHYLIFYFIGPLLSLPGVLKLNSFLLVFGLAFVNFSITYLLVNAGALFFKATLKFLR